MIMEQDIRAEQDLLAKCRQGDDGAWDRLFDFHYEAACRYVFQLASDLSREDAREIAQEAFVTVVQNLKTFEGKCRFRTWLFRIAANKAHDFRDKRHAAKRGGGQPTESLDAAREEGGPSSDEAAPEPTPDVALLHVERNVFLGEALDALGEPCREMLQLRYFGDMTYEEIGNLMDLNIKTVSSRLSRCLDHMEGLASAVFAGGGIDDLPPSNE